MRIKSTSNKHFYPANITLHDRSGFYPFYPFKQKRRKMKLMKQVKTQEIALMRYGAIAPIIAGLDERYPNKTAFYTEISAKGLMGPDGKLHHYAPATIAKMVS